MNIDIGIIDGVRKALDVVRGAVDDLHTSDEERMQLNNKLKEIENQALEKALELKILELKSQASIVEQEAKSEHWLTATWRPITALVFVLIICLHYAGLLAFELSNEMWDVLKIMIGGYVVSRGGEKMVKEYKKHE